MTPAAPAARIVIDEVIPALNPIDQPMSRFTNLLLACLTLVLGTAGCHRQFYRKQADCEVRELVAEKSHDVARPPNRPWDFQVDRRSRMFNPFDLDFQPMPLDDPASYRYMQCVDGRRGYPMWEAAGITNTTESPDWWQFLPLDDDGVLVLNQENAVRIALLHSDDYQREVESLYFAALEVSRERFQFDTQFFGGLGNDLTADGRRRGGSAGRSSTRYRFGPNNLTMNRTFATGAELIANVANTVTWELSGDNSQTASTLLDFTLLQPLLRGAGRDRILEGLTQAERDLLAQVRSFERFRRSFFLRITTGRGLDLSRTGIVSINAGGIGATGGYLGLLQQQLRIRNQEENIARQTENLLLTENNLIELLTKIPDRPSEIISERLQVAQARSRLLNSESSLIDQQANYQRSVDTFMRDLGLPPYICAKLVDPILDRFQLIDRELLQRREQLSAVRSNVGAINVKILDFGETVTNPDTNLPETRVAWTPELKQLIELLRNELQPMTDFNRKLIEEDLPLILTDVDEFEASLTERESQTLDLKELYETESDSICSLLGVTGIDESIFDLEEVKKLGDDLRKDHGELQGRLEGYNERIAVLAETLERLATSGPADQDPVAFADSLREDVILFSQDLLAEMGDDVLEIQLIQARARTESVLLPEVDIDPVSAFEVARRNRRDWANARAAVVDSWRQIEFVADQLESTLNVTFSGDVGNVGNNPFKLRSTTGRLRVGLAWDAPITRLLERNDYRSTLIQYEQTKRQYYNYEDAIWQLLRNEIRTLQANRYQFEIGRQSVRIAAEQIELNGDIRTLNEAQGLSSGPTAARDAIDALNFLLDAQNGLLGVFVTYETVRRTLDLDLGTMELTPEGLWIDPGVISPDNLMGLPGTTLDGLIECGCNDCGLKYDPLPPEPIFSDTMLRVGPTVSAEVEMPEEMSTEVPLEVPQDMPAELDGTEAVPAPQTPSPQPPMPEPLDLPPPSINELLPPAAEASAPKPAKLPPFLGQIGQLGQ